MDTPYQRARTAAEKHERRDHLLATARAALREGTDPRALSLTALARQAGMAKANIYRYFESREAVLLALLVEEWAAVASGLCADFPAPGAAPLGVPALAGRLSAALLQRPLLSALIAALPSELEHNLSPDAIAAFKRLTFDSFRQVGAAMALACPSLTAPQHAQLLHDACVVIAGLHPFCHPAAPAADAMLAPDLAPLRRDYAKELPRFIAALAAAAAQG